MVHVLDCFHVSVIIFFLCFGFSHEISCKDERDRDVDWYVNYKIPKIEKEPAGSNLEEGRAYTYITAPGIGSWKLSTNSIESGSMLENTLKNFYSNKQRLTYLFYNDDPPSNFSGTAVGHLKGLFRYYKASMLSSKSGHQFLHGSDGLEPASWAGVVAFDGQTGYWLVHSIPKFADDKVFQYPENAYVNGQSILCVTFRTSELNEISNQLLYSHPNIYSYSITDEVKAMLDDKAKTLFTDNPSFVRRDPLTRTASLKSVSNKVFISFAKDNQYKDDLYSGIIAPGLKSSLLVETWRRGSGSFLPPSCESDYSVLDIVSINMSITSRRNTKNIVFRSTEDHSKWAIAQNGGRNWVCIADMNRMLSQERRGGGALCFLSAPVKNAYQSIISETDQCPRSRNSIVK